MRGSPSTLLLLGLLSVPALANPPNGAGPPPVKITPEMANAIFEGKIPNGALPPGVRTPPAPPVDPTEGLPPEMLPPYSVSTEFFTDLIRHDLDGVVAYSKTPFTFDGHTAATPEEIRRSWARVLSEQGHNHPTMYSLEILPYDEMVKRYGPPPAKLSEMVWKGTLVALANLDGRAELAFLRRDSAGVWRVYGYSD